MAYLRGAPTRLQTPQSSPIPGAGQSVNSAGGYVWEVTPLVRLKRFILLGADGATYYASARQHLEGNIACLSECDPFEAIDEIVKISDEGRAPKNDPAIFALAFYAGHEDVKVRQRALEVLPEVCRTSTHLFQFAGFVSKQRGWGRSLRRSIGKWYAEKTPEQVAYQMVKYRSREGWTHRDLLRKAHPGYTVSAGNPMLELSTVHQRLFQWAAGHETDTTQIPRIIEGHLFAMSSPSPQETARLITEYDLPREAILDTHLDSREVWEALFDNMPLTAMIRNLPSMTRVGLIAPMSAVAQEVTRRLTDQTALKRSRVHPLAMLTAHLTYANGQSLRGSNTWNPVREIVDALDAGFYAAFGNVAPTGKRHLLALDISGSMDGGMINGVPGLTPRVASAAMALVTAATGDPVEFIAFTSNYNGYAQPTWTTQRSGLLIAPQVPQYNEGVTQINISPKQRLGDVCRYTQNLPMGGTDCALPWLYATRENREVDICVTYTDSETWANPQMHPSQALQQYRQHSGIQARSVVVGMVSNGFTIADPRDTDSLDVVGFDAAAPQMISDFAAGLI